MPEFIIKERSAKPPRFRGKKMQKKLTFIVVLSLLLTGCRMQVANRLVNGGSPSVPSDTQAPPTVVPAEVPTNTPIPSPTATLVPTPDPAAVGLPAESSGTDAFDFVATMCKAEWFTRGGALPCPGDEADPNAGFVLSLPADRQDLPPGYPVLLMYPPQQSFDTIFSKYPIFTVQKGDRFRAVLACRLHSFCDVEFAIDYYDANGGKSGIAHWPYRFTAAPVVIDYPLDGIAGLTVQFSLSLRAAGPNLDAYGVWIFPHIYRPAS